MATKGLISLLAAMVLALGVSVPPAVAVTFNAARNVCAADDMSPDGRCCPAGEQWNGAYQSCLAAGVGAIISIPDRAEAAFVRCGPWPLRPCVAPHPRPKPHPYWCWRGRWVPCSLIRGW